jgi:hypothetical protein
MRSEKSRAPRKQVNFIAVKNLATLEPFTVISKEAEIVDASSTGFLLYVNRKHLVPKHLRANLSLKPLEGERIMLKIEDMNLDIDGLISRTKFIGNGIFEIAIDFSEDAPEYWRECLIELLPSSDEEI